MKKKLLTVFLILVASLFSAKSWGQSGDFGENNALHWVFDGSFPTGTITISGQGAMPNYDYGVLPPWFTYANVISSKDSSPIFPLPPNYK